MKASDLHIKSPMCDILKFMNLPEDIYVQSRRFNNKVVQASNLGNPDSFNNIFKESQLYLDNVVDMFSDDLYLSITYDNYGYDCIFCRNCGGEEINNPFGPAQLRFNPQILVGVCYFKDHKKHRIDGPANIIYGNDGMKYAEYYYINNKRHNPIGPAVRTYAFYEDRPIWVNLFYIQDIKITLDTFCKRARNV